MCRGDVVYIGTAVDGGAEPAAADAPGGSKGTRLADGPDPHLCGRACAQACAGHLCFFWKYLGAGRRRTPRSCPGCWGYPQGAAFAGGLRCAHLSQHLSAPTPAR